MRIDYLTIFPEYFSPLALSLPGKAQAKGLVQFVSHDLRDWTHDRHRTVDDTPFGGGAGMVMAPQPWGSALDDVASPESILVVPTPSGRPFSQAVARDLAQAAHLVFLCGRYEGIDQRVLDDAAQRWRVVEVSLGDYVLNGGEVAALAMTEAIVRLLPGFMGNPDSLVEESHEQGLLEYPVYTKPASWRGHDVPAVLLSGNHQAIAAWRRELALQRTIERRPDLRRSGDRTGLEFRTAVAADAEEILVLQRSCWVQELLLNPQLTAAEMPALTESVDDVRRWLGEQVVITARDAGRLVGAARGMLLPDDVWEISRVMIAADLQGQGLGRRLLAEIEGLAPSQTRTCRLFVAPGSERNQRLYRKAGYRVVPTGPQVPIRGAVQLEKRRRAG